MGIRSLLNKSLASLVIGATINLVSPSFSRAAEDDLLPKGKVTTTLIENSRYMANTHLMFSESSLDLGFNDLKDGSIGIGGFRQLFNYMFATPGKFKRPAFMAEEYFGKHIPNYVELDWHKYLGQHLNLGAYESELHLLPEFMNSEEDFFDELRTRFGFSQFHRRPTMVFYMNGTQFLQDKLFYPSRGIAGVTKVLGNNEMATYFDGRKQDFAHVSKHEFVHWFDIQRMEQIGIDKGGKPLNGMQLWQIEGLAEYYSSGWSSTHEQIMRDLWHNGIFIPLQELDNFNGSFLTYTFGNFYTKFLEESFGSGTALKIRDNAHLGDLEAVLEGTTGKKLDELNRMAKEYLHEHLKDLDGRVDSRKQVAEGFLLASDSNRFLTWDFDEGHIKMYLNRVSDKELVKTQVVQDFEYGLESLFGLFESGGVGMRGNRIVFPVSDSGRDKLVVRNFSVYGDEFKLEGMVEKSFDSIEEMASPQFINDDNVVFIGSSKGHQDIYTYDFNKDKLSRLTNEQRGLHGLDVSGNLVVFSREDEKTGNPNNCDYNFNLYTLDMHSGKLTKLTSGDEDDMNPRFSPDGRRIVFQREENFVNNLYIYYLDKGVAVRLDKEIIGAENPQFLGNNRVLLNSTKLLEPRVLTRDVGSLDDLVRAQLEQDTSVDVGVFRVRKNELLLKDPLVADDTGLKVDDRKVKSIISDGKKLYFTTEDGTYVKKDKFERLEPYPMEKRVHDFMSYIHDDYLLSVDKASVSYDIKVSEDGKSGVVFLNPTFASKKFMRLIPDGATPVLLYTDRPGIPKNEPIAYYIESDMAESLEKSEVEFLANKQVLISNSKGMVPLNPTSNRSLVDVVNELVKKEDIDGKINDIVVSKDKRFVALSYFDNDMLYDDYALVLYDSMANSAKVVQSTEDFKIGGVRFLNDGSLFFSGEDDKALGFYRYNPVTGELVERKYAKYPGEKLDELAATGDAVLFSVVSDGVSYVYSIDSSGLTELFSGGANKNLHAVDDILLYERTDSYGKHEQKLLDSRVTVIGISRSKQTANGHFIVDDSGKLYDIDLASNKASQLAEPSFGFNVRENSVLFSKTDNGLFNIFRYDTVTAKLEQLTSNKFNSFRPVFDGDVVYYEADEGNSPYVRKIKDSVDERVPLSAPVVRMEVVHDELQGYALSKSSKGAAKSDRNYTYDKGVISQKEFSQWPIYDRSGQLMAMYGNGFALMIDYYGFNELHDKAIAASAYSLGAGSGLYSAGFFDLKKDYALNWSLVDFGHNRNTGFTFTKLRPMNSYLGTEGFVGLNYQDYPRFVGSTRNNVYPVVGVALTYDDTLFDYLRGPREGTRGLLRLETGYSITDNKMNNYDVNFDLRNYLPFIGRLGMSERLMAGTSQGPNNHLYLLGGNISMRGVPFDDLLGQNYAVANLDLKFPLFEALGAVVADTRFFNPLITAFDVRAGLYCDAGAVWDNQDRPKPLYSVGYEASGIFFGSMILRYNKGLYGEKDWNFWLGYSP